jgi:hypothetical protein
MKRKSILPMLVLACGLFVAACNDAEYTALDNSVYIVEAATSAKSANVSMETSGADINVTVRLAKQLSNDVSVKLSLNEALLNEFNTAGNTNYQMLPKQYFTWNEAAALTIPAGEISTTLKIHVDNFDMQGKRYALPITIDNVTEGSISKSESQSKFVYVVAKPLITSVPVMKAVDNVGVRAEPLTPWGIVTPQWSWECWIRMSAYSKNNQCIFDNRNEIYVRFGDANAPYNYLQIKFNGDGGKQTARDLVAGEWYHWAFVFDGSTLTLYRNGEVDFSFTYPPVAGDGVHFDEMWWISSSPTYFPDLCSMSQMRLWKTAISQTQIKNNMYYEIDPTDPNLIAYWPMNEGSGDVFADISGNGHNATASISGSNHTIQRWEHDVRFDK